MNTNKIVEVGVLLGTLLIASPTLTWAQSQDSPDRAVRVIYSDGSVSFQPGGTGDWLDASGQLLSAGDNLWADKNSSAELDLESAAIRVESETSVTLLGLDDHTKQLKLSLGSIIVWVNRLSGGDLFEIHTPNLVFRVQQPGEYKIDANAEGNETDTTVWRGKGEATNGSVTYVVETGQQARFTGTDQLAQEIVQISNRRDFDTVASRPQEDQDKPVEIRDLEDFGAAGRWVVVPGLGTVWAPTTWSERVLLPPPPLPPGGIIVGASQSAGAGNVIAKRQNPSAVLQPLLPPQEMGSQMLHKQNDALSRGQARNPRAANPNLSAAGNAAEPRSPFERTTKEQPQALKLLFGAGTPFPPAKSARYTTDAKLTMAMQVSVLFFGLLKDLMAREGESLSLPEGATLADLLSYYESRVPRLQSLMSSIAVSVNQEYAGRETKLSSGDEVALLPPVSGGLPRCAIVREKIEPQVILQQIKQPMDGAAVVFEGVVRDNTRGRRTLYLIYESYEEMALKQMEGLAEKALSDFKVREVAIVHRLGRMEIGETSVLIVVASAHRAAAFEASRWLIDTLKRTVPIWKKEYFEDGAVWADGDPFPAEIPRAGGTPSGQKPASK